MKSTVLIFVFVLYAVAYGQRPNKKLKEYIREGRIWGIVKESEEKREEDIDDGKYWEYIGETEKKAEDNWVWGIVTEEKTKINNKKENTRHGSETDHYDPCQRYNPKKPNFKSPGRRISEQKCTEYLWGVLVREEKLKRRNECAIKIKKDPSTTITKKIRYVLGGSTLYNSFEYPHMGALGWKTKIDGQYAFKCGSTLISRKFLLTSAHCCSTPVDDYIIESSPKIVRLGNTNLEIPFHDVEIIKITPHPNFNNSKQYYDIALMELEFELILTDIIQPACLWTKYDTAELGNVAKITGWGALRFGSREISTDLQVAEVNLMNSTFCDELMFTSRNKKWQGLMEHQMCAGKLDGGVDACQGDSGGPLQVVKYKSDRGALYNVIGVTSFGIACGQANLPAVYTRVSSFIDWIENIVWK